MSEIRIGVWTRRAVVLLCTATLAALLVAPPATADTGGDTARDRVRLRHCSEQFVVRGVDPAELEVRLPDGFALAAPFGLGEGLAEVATFAIECRRGGATVNEVYEMLAVDVPEEEAIGAGNWVLLDGTTTKTRSWVRWARWCFVGGVSWGHVDDAVVVEEERRRGHVAVDSWRGDLLLTTSVPVPGTEVPAGSAGMFALRGGEVVGRVLWEWTAAQLSIGEGTYARDGDLAEAVPLAGHSFVPEGGQTYTFTGLTDVRDGCGPDSGT